MAVETSGNHRQIERRLDAVLIPRPHVITAIRGVPINGCLEPVAFSVVEIGATSVSGANVVFQAAPPMQASDFKFPGAVIIEPHLAVFHRNAILHSGRLMAERRGRSVFSGRAPGRSPHPFLINVLPLFMASRLTRLPL